MTFEDILATWLVKQRWFAGKGRTVHDLAVVADTEIIPGDPGLRHLVVTVSHGATSDCYQLFIGYRARLPARLRHASIGEHAGLQIYDGLHDTALTRTLLDAIVDDRSVGPLRFCRMPGAEIEAGLDSLVLTGEQSNTSLVFGESAIFKVFRRVTPGPNPDLEVASALARLGSSHIAEPLGWVETRMDGAPAVLAILSRYLRAASDGWSLAATSVRDLYATEEGTRAAEATSRSGFGPAVTRRNTLKMADSPNTRLVLLCSPVSTRLSRPASPFEISAPGIRQNRSMPTLRSSTIASSSVRVSAVSCSPS